MTCLSVSSEISPSRARGVCPQCTSSQVALTLLAISVLLGLAAYLCHHYHVGRLTMPILTVASSVCFVSAGIVKIGSVEVTPPSGKGLPQAAPPVVQPAIQGAALTKEPLKPAAPLANPDSTPPAATVESPPPPLPPRPPAQQILMLYRTHSTLEAFTQALGKQLAALTPVEQNTLFDKIIREKEGGKQPFGAILLKAILPFIALQTLQEKAHLKLTAAMEFHPEAAQVLLDDDRFPLFLKQGKCLALIECVKHNRPSLLPVLLKRKEFVSTPQLIQAVFKYTPTNGSMPVAFNALEWAYCFQKKEKGAEKEKWHPLIAALKQAGVNYDPKPDLLAKLYRDSPETFLKMAGDLAPFTSLQETHFLCKGLSRNNQAAFNQMLHVLAPYLSEAALNAVVRTPEEKDFLLLHFMKKNPPGAEILIAHPATCLVFKQNLTALHHAATHASPLLVSAILRRNDFAAHINDIAVMDGIGLCTALDLATDECATIIADAGGKKASQLQAIHK